MRPWLRAARNRAVGSHWGRVFVLAVVPFVAGVAVLVLWSTPTALELGSSLIGGSVIGLVFAMVQHTLDGRAAARKQDDDLRLTVSSNASLQGIDLQGQDFSNAYLRNKELRNARLDRTLLAGADLRDADLSDATVTDADLRAADLTGARLLRADLARADLSNATLSADRLLGASMVGARLVGARVRAPEPGEAGDRESGDPEAADQEVGGPGDTSPVDLSLATLDRAHLGGVPLDHARAAFASAVHLDASGARLRGATLVCADLRGAALQHADLSGADLRGADLRGAVLQNTTLDGARLVGARLDQADLIDASLVGADLSRADLRGAYQARADLTGALTDGTVGIDPAAVLGWSEPATPPASPDGRIGTAPRLVVDHDGSDEARRLADELLDELDARTALLSRLVDDVDAVLQQGPMDPGTPAEHGLPGSAVLRGGVRRGRKGDVVATISSNGGRPTVQLSAGGDGSEPATGVGPASGAGPAPGPAPGAAPGAAPVTDGVAAADVVQAALAPPDGLVDAADVARMREVLAHLRWSYWGEGDGQLDDAELDDRLGLLRDRNPRCVPVLLVTSSTEVATGRGVSTRTLDDCTLLWAWSEQDDVRRAAAATLGTHVLAQLIHRTTAPASLLQTSGRAAAERAISLLTPASGRPTDRELALQARARHAHSFIGHVTERPDALVEGIDRYRSVISDLEERRLTVPLTTRNNLAYCHMARSGRHTKGPDADDYLLAREQLEAVLASSGLAAPDPGADSMWDTHRWDSLVGAHTTSPAPALTVAALVRDGVAGLGDADLRRQLSRRPVQLALANLGNLHRLHKAWGAALVSYDAALVLNPAYIEAHKERAVVLLDRNETDAADAAIAAGMLALADDPDEHSRLLRTVADHVDALNRRGLTDRAERWRSVSDLLTDHDPGWTAALPVAAAAPGGTHGSGSSPAGPDAPAPGTSPDDTRRDPPATAPDPAATTDLTVQRGAP